MTAASCWSPTKPRPTRSPTRLYTRPTIPRQRESSTWRRARSSRRPLSRRADRRQQPAHQHRHGLRARVHRGDQGRTQAFVTLQEANAIAVLDLNTNGFTEVIGLGAKDFNMPGNEIDPKDNDGAVSFISVAAKGLYMPDAIATYKWQRRHLSRDGERRRLPRGQRRSRCRRARLRRAAPLDRLRVVDTAIRRRAICSPPAPDRSRSATPTATRLRQRRLLDTKPPRAASTTTAAAATRASSPKASRCSRSPGAPTRSSGSSARRKGAVAIFDITSPYDVRSST